MARKIQPLTLACAIGLAATGAAQATTLNSALRVGDLFMVQNTQQTLWQYRPGSNTPVTTIDFSYQAEVQGVFAGLDSSLYIASGNTAFSPSQPLQIERIGIGQTTGTVVLGASAFSGIAGLQYIRDVAVANDGTIYTMLFTGNTSSAPLYKFTPDGLGGYNAGALLTNVNINAGYTTYTDSNSNNHPGIGDSGSAHIDLSADGRYIVSGSRSDNNVYTINTATGALKSLNVGTLTNSSMTGEVAIDPTGTKVFFGTVNGSTNVDQLFEIAFDPATGLFDPASLKALSLNNTSAVIDSMDFDPITGDLVLTSRDSAIHRISAATLAAAEAGTLFNLSSQPTVISGGNTFAARDLALVAAPLPSAAAMGLPLLGGSIFVGRRRRR